MEKQMTAEEARKFDRYSLQNAMMVKGSLSCQCDPYQDVYTMASAGNAGSERTAWDKTCYYKRKWRDDYKNSSLAYNRILPVPGGT